ncbi:Mitogen-activated_protein kinase [Hexamita inflata]|uniref:Mitogen-activated protein kinase n=1 Tax=Hexamita inflata TaxID=28002 RepID=A0AA86NXW8_9EUKA|nr:Mitogen-activated protein kinase [Hexamita inflata]
MSADDSEVEKHVLKKYELVHKVGKGAYGIVWKAQNKKSGEFVALKKIFQAFQNETDSQRTYREVMFLTQFDHANIVRLQNVIRAENDIDIYLIFDFMESDLHKVIQAGILQEPHKQYILYQLLKSIKYLHSGGLLHRDLKPSNCLLNSACDLKLCDFGLARTLESSSQEAANPVYTDYVATRWYRPPELLLGSPKYDKPVDMWAIGCILGEMLGQKPMFPGSSATSQIELVLQVTGRPSAEDLQSLKSPYAAAMLEQLPQSKKKNLKELYPKASDEALDLMSKLLVFNPNKRLTVEQCIEHPFFTNFRVVESETVADAPFQTAIDDNKRLSVAEYRENLYSEIAMRKKQAKDARRGDVE